MGGPPTRAAHWALVVVVWVGFSCLVAAGRAEPGAPPPVSTVAVSLTDFGIRLSAGTVQRGRVTFRVTNRGFLPHSFAIAGKRTKALANAKRESITVTLPRAGSYRFSSAMPGDAAIGMSGSLRVVTRRVSRPQPVSTKSRLRLTRLAGNLGPLTHVVAPPEDEQRVLVVRQAGRVLLFKNGVRQERPFLDLENVVRAEGEGGLLSLAFAPDYARSGVFYAFFTNAGGNIRIVEMRRSSADPDVADPASRRRVLAIGKLAPNHNGGMLQFGPDRYLYVSVGDGGANPPDLPVGHFGQTITDLFSTILRIDPQSRAPYAIPPGNPFVDVPEARPEIVAYGLRNPWRFWIDAPTKTMLIGDVGESDREEIDRLPLDRLGLNFGWPCKEGTVTTLSAADMPPSCASATLTAPLYEYSHAAGRCSITGGVVARDPALRALDGLYLWADYCEGAVRALTADGRIMHLGLQVDRPSSFGVDGLGRVYVVTGLGELYRFELGG